MMIEDIHEGGIYRGAGACFVRHVDFIFEQGSRKFVHWFTPNTMPATMRDGRTFWTPNRTCSIEHFARWARSHVSDER